MQLPCQVFPSRILYEMSGVRPMTTKAIAVLLAFASCTVALRIPRHATVASRELVNETKYDFVIAGGGVSGLTVADRLTEDPSSM